MGDQPYWRSEEFAVHLSCKLDSETHPRIKAFSLTACRLEAVSLAGMGKAEVSFIFLKKRLGSCCGPYYPRQQVGHLGEHIRRVPPRWGCVGRDCCRTPFWLPHLFIGKAESFGVGTTGTVGGRFCLSPVVHWRLRAGSTLAYPKYEIKNPIFKEWGGLVTL